MNIKGKNPFIIICFDVKDEMRGKKSREEFSFVHINDDNK